VHIRFLLAAFFCVTSALAQGNRAPFSPWLFPGAGWQLSQELKLLGQYGYNPQLNMHAAYLQAYINTGRHITLNPAYLYLGRNNPALQEHTFMHGIIFSFPLGKLRLDERNMLWSRFRSHSEDIHYYRNRLRLSLPLHGHSVRPYVFNEVFHLFNRGRWSRNRIAAGIAGDITKSINIDISYIHQRDYYDGASHILFVMGTWQFSRLNGKIK
jgi:hypothetical protein